MADEIEGEQPQQEEETVLELTEEMADAADEVVVLLGDEEIAPEDDKETPTWVKDLRKQRREDKQRIRDLEAKLATQSPAANDEDPGEEPTLEGCDYDTEKWKAEFKAWQGRVEKRDSSKTTQQQAEQEAQDAWNATVVKYNTAKVKLGVRDYEVAEDAATSALSVTQQGIILQGAERPELVMYALGRNPAKLEELSGIADPVRFAFAIAKMEGQLKTTTRKPATAAETKIKGATGNFTGSALESQLDKLREDAAKGVPGAMQKIAELKRQKAAA